MRHNLDRNNERVAIYNPFSGKATQLSAIEREMQQLNQAADFADRGLDAASEERKREQLRKRAELDRQSRERDEAARNANQSASDNESGNSSGSSKSR